MTNSRCCYRCKTPYNCGNPSCACHLNQGAALAWNARHQEPTPTQRFTLAALTDDD